MARPWVMLYTELVNDPKMIMLSDSAYRRFIELLLYAGETDRDGEIADTTFIAVKCRKSLVELQPDLNELEAAGIIHQEGELWYISKWANRQPPTTTADRVRKHRAKKRQEKQRQAKTSATPPPAPEVTLPDGEGVTLQQRYSNVQIREENKEKEIREESTPPKPPPKKRQPAPGRRAGVLKNPALDLPVDLAGLKRDWQLFQKHRMEINKPVRETEAQLLFERFRGWGIERSAAALKYTAGNSWQGVQDDPQFKNSARAPAGSNGQYQPVEVVRRRNNDDNLARALATLEGGNNG